MANVDKAALLIITIPCAIKNAKKSIETEQLCPHKIIEILGISTSYKFVKKKDIRYMLTLMGQKVIIKRPS